MNIHIFNPEHEWAMASATHRYTAPHAARQMRRDLGWLPSLWARPTDLVLVDDEGAAQTAMRRWPWPLNGRLITPEKLTALLASTSTDAPLRVQPWGWDATLRHQLLQLGVSPSLLPSEMWLEQLRAVSHRAWAVRNVLPALRQISGTVGEAVEVRTMQALDQQVRLWGEAVVKAPWSCSGRGVRYVLPHELDAPALPHSFRGWAQRVLATQGSLMVEPRYNMVCNLALEYQVERSGARLLGLSLFTTANGKYTGNLLTDEDEKWLRLARYIHVEKVHQVATRLTALLSEHLAPLAPGPVGVDMMVVRPAGTTDTTKADHLLHPCVEINVRRTMGHVALSLPTPRFACSMRLVAEDRYKLRVYYNA